MTDNNTPDKYQKITEALSNATATELSNMLESLRQGKRDVVQGVQLTDFEAGHLASELGQYLRVLLESGPKILPNHVAN